MPELPEIAVVIPTLNEAGSLPALLEDLSAQVDTHLQVIIADGGSTDATPEIARQTGTRIVTTSPGRGRQMNAGAAAAECDSLLFLHADSRLGDPAMLRQALDHWMSALGGQSHCAGHFRLKFTGASKERLLYRYMEGKTAFNRPHCFNGDQGLLINRGFLQQLGGFDESLHFLEDQRLGERIRSNGCWITLPGCIESSARRFETAGPARQWLLMFLIMGAYGAPVPEFLEQAPALYRKHGSRLYLTPYLRCYVRIMWRRGWRDSLRGWWGLGGFAASHSWQLFYFWDVVIQNKTEPRRYPLLACYDRTLGLLAETWPVRLIAASLMFTLVFVVLWPVLELYEAVSEKPRPASPG